MFKIVLSAIMSMVASPALLLAAVAGLDYIADGITIFTDPGVWFIRAVVGWALAVGIIYILGYMTFKEFAGGNSFFDRFMSGGTGQSRGIIGSMRKRMGLD